MTKGADGCFIAHRLDAPAAMRALREARDFIEAALLYAEECDGADEEVVIRVLEPETGRSRCFRIDLSSGAVKAC
jgi:hypothetical protein